MKKQLIAVGLAGLLTIPAVSFSAEMGGASLYGSFRTGLIFGSGDAKVSDIGSRWGITGSHEVAEGLTASYKYEGKINTTNAESFGGEGHSHAGAAASAASAASTDYDFNQLAGNVLIPQPDDENGDPVEDVTVAISAYNPNLVTLDTDDDGNIVFDENGHATETKRNDAGDVEGTPTKYQVIDSHSSNARSARPAHAKTDANGGPGGRLSNISLSGGFGAITLGQIWSASAIHYGFAVDPSYYNGVFGGASYRQGNSVSYSSSAGDVSFQIDKVTGDGEKVEVGASAAFGPIGVGVGYSRSNVDESSFTGVAISAGAAGVNLTIGLGSSDSATGAESDTSILHVGGSLGDTGVSYALQVANSDGDGSDQNLIVLTNSLGSGASLIFEHLDPGGDGDSSSLLGLKVDF
jgi:predicted porin